MLAPLGLCFLPAFVCLGVVPLVLGIAGDVFHRPCPQVLAPSTDRCAAWVAASRAGRLGSAARIGPLTKEFHDDQQHGSTADASAHPRRPVGRRYATARSGA